MSSLNKHSNKKVIKSRYKLICIIVNPNYRLLKTKQVSRKTVQ